MQNDKNPLQMQKETCNQKRKEIKYENIEQLPNENTQNGCIHRMKFQKYKGRISARSRDVREVR